jgi:hypothetical protein
MPKLSEILGEAYSKIPEEIKNKYEDIDLVDSSSYVDKENEDLQNKIYQYEKDYKKLKEDSQNKISEMKFDYALEEALNKSGAKNSKAIKALLDTGKIKLDGESIIGLDEQLKNLKTSDPYLFAENKIVTPKPGDGISTSGESSLVTKIAKERNKQVKNPYKNMWK